MSTLSPEITGLYFCTKCGNDTEFVGVDVNGFGGRAACMCGAEAQGAICTCRTRLTQQFTMVNGQPAPSRVSGDNLDAVIGDYTSIECGECGNVIWENL